MQPVGVAGVNNGSRPFIASKPMLMGWKPSFVNVRWQRQLDENAVNHWVIVKRFDGGFNFFLCAFGGHHVGDGGESHLIAGFTLHANILCRCGVIAC
jgi:hypothetical protein